MLLEVEQGYIGLDFETYSAVDLSTHGLYRYTNDDTFRVLVAAVAFDTATGLKTHSIDLTEDFEVRRAQLRKAIGDDLIVAHNASFEKQVLHMLGLDYPPSRFIDSAAIARAVGAGSSLEAAAPQLLGTDKLESGRNLIKLFCVPGSLQEIAGDGYFNRAIVKQFPTEWAELRKYCDLDALLSLNIYKQYQAWLPQQEYVYQSLTLRMNEFGWHVDLELVEEMQRRYLENLGRARRVFDVTHHTEDLNLNSLKQMKEWCAERGVRANSFDEKNVDRLMGRLTLKLQDMTLPTDKRVGYHAVLDLLKTKKILGGSSLKKLQVIKDTVHDDRLFDQYVHAGAGQTLRTSGRSVQMQNLKRLASVDPVDELLNGGPDWNNDQLAANLRQVFTASNYNGQLIVGDFSSVESRGLAWLAGENWKLRAYKQGKDLYKELAADMFGRPSDTISKAERQIGKVGELSCGYGAGAGAVQAFAENMGIELSEAESVKLVSDWRDANPAIVKFWGMLDDALHMVVEGDRACYLPLDNGLGLAITNISSPDSLKQQRGDVTSLQINLTSRQYIVMTRYVHGCYVNGRNICYHRASDRKTGDLWRPTFTDPKTKATRNFELYGGKLAGILTQSLCRELFFSVLHNMYNEMRTTGMASQAEIVGQFHDEIVVDWRPGTYTLAASLARIEVLMSRTPTWAFDFPLAAEVKSDYRYTK